MLHIYVGCVDLWLIGFLCYHQIVTDTLDKVTEGQAIAEEVRDGPTTTESDSTAVVDGLKSFSLEDGGEFLVWQMRG